MSEYIQCDECDEDAYWFGPFGALCKDCYLDLELEEEE